MATLRNTHTARLRMPEGEGFPKGGVLPPNSVGDVSDEYLASVKDNPSVRIWVKAGWLVISNTSVEISAPPSSTPASPLGQAMAVGGVPVIAESADDDDDDESEAADPSPTLPLKKTRGRAR